MSHAALNLNYQTTGFSQDLALTTESLSSQTQCIHQLFAQQAEKTPDALAIVFENQQLTYRELNAKANQLAHYLQEIGVGPEVFVGLCVERSIEVVIGILGILKAGGAYVPLDPAYPQERLAFMLEDSNLKVILTKTQWLEILPVINASVFCLDADWQKIEQQSQENPISDITPENLAYLIYTSGSTGKPKGVQMPHASIWNYLQGINKIIPVNNQDIYLQTASFSFTASVRQLFLPLSQGATSVIATREQTRTPLSLFELIQTQGVTISDGVPSVWRYGLLALESLDQKYTTALSESQLKYIIFGGELLPYQLIKKLRNLFQNPPRFFNILGQTESIGNAFYAIPENSDIEEGYVPVGNPLQDIQQVYVLNSQLEPVKNGESGELHIAGATLARGYLNRTQANAEKFINNPFNPQQKLFKTGDVARYSQDGSLEILGRIDFQVNIRGMRVELEEIEAVLKLHPSVREGVVSLREDIPGDQRLVAYIVPNNQALDLAEIRSFIEHKVPDYMVPNAFVVMEKLPVLPNGKLDRNNLPAPNISADLLNFVAPRNPQEQLIANIWAEVLGLEKVGINDNFLELGGHSLLASLVISRLREALAVELPVSVLFEAPTVAGLSEKIENLSHQNQPHQSLPTLEPIERSVELPLSLIQQRFWILDQMEGANAAYNIARALRLVGSLNLTALQQAIQSIIQRHETLRTSFGILEGKPVQFIAETLPFTLPLVDLQQLPEVEREAELQRLITAEYTEPFDLSQAPLLRVKLIRLESNSHILLVTMHHIISDAWSAGIFLKELSSLYADSPLADLPIQYADYAYWQRQWLQNDIINTQLNYWKQQLADAPPILELPTDYPRSAQTFRGSIQRFKLGNDLTSKLKTLSQKSGNSLFMTLQAAFVTFLYRYTGQEDIVIGSPITNRNRPALESLIGFFVNTLVLRTRLENNPTFRELLSQVRQVALDAYVHQDLPFDRLIEALQPERHKNLSPLFQVMFVLQNSPLEKPNLPGLNVTPIELDRPTAGATFDLTLSMQEIDAQLTGAFEYNANLFDAATIARMVDNFQTLVEAIVTNPDERVGQLPLLTAAQKHQLLVEWNNTKADYPRQCIHQLFEQQVERTPDALAIQWENQQLTYRELNNRANQLAHYLQNLGVGAETLVGVYLERSFEMIVSLLGILKAGGAYVPLDPNYPPERLNYMVADSQMSVILTHSLLLPHLSSTLESAPIKTICWDKDLQVIASQNLDEPINNVQPGNLAYVIYTSGSTGKPKAVMIEHSGLLNLVFWHLNNFEVKSSDRATSLAGTAFDAAVWELWPYLVVGASVHLIDSEIILSAPMLQQHLISKNITISFIPTPLAEQLCLFCWPENTALRIMLTGGDRLNNYPLSTLPFKLFNNYGPTENTVVTTSGQILPEESESKLPPIGRPIPNTQVYILDRYLQPVPIGVAGELYIGGASLARGYLNRPELTAEKFINNPFIPGERLYKTGDLVRFLPDGNIEFIGRIDHQVKIRGFRIELGEIETLLGQHPQVQQVVVIVREDNPGHKYIAAYVVNENLTLTSSELRQFLKEHLPEYMIPSAFVILNAFPLNPNGKIDRRALPVPNLADNRETAFVPPRNPTEEIIADIIANVLGVEKVGIYDNFFELGGHSLLATQVISRLRAAFNVELPLRCLFESPTVAELEKFIDPTVETTSVQIAPAIVPCQNLTEIPLSFAQARLWFLNELEGASATYNMPFGVHIQGNLNVKALTEAIQEIVNRHSILRTNFQVINGSTVQVINPSVTIPLSIVKAENIPADPEQFRHLATLESQKPFDLTNDCLIRGTVWQFSSTEHLLLLTLHHIVSDGWSMAIFMQELSTLYQAFTQELPSPLPELTLQYADYAVWQRNWFTSEVLATQQNYWKQQLADAPQLLKLPTDRPRPAVQTFQGASVELEINSQVAQQIKTLSQQSGATLYMTLLTAFATLLSRYSGQEDILIGSPVANRHHQATESLIGFFANTLVMRTKLLGNPTFLELLQQVRQVTLDAYVNQDIPFEQVVEALQPERSLSYTPLFQVMFDLQQEPLSWQLPGLSLESVEKEHKVAKFDLTLEVVQTAAGIRLKWEYNSDLFNRETIWRMSNNFQTLLAGIIANPQQPVKQLPLLTAAEQNKLLVEWNNTQLHYPQNASLPDLFAKQVQQTPNNIAVEFADQKLTYKQLDQQANQLANYLQTLGVGTETLVGLCVERSPLMIVGLLGILKAGAAYLPLDPSYPQERLAFMLSDSQASILLTQEKLVSSLPKQNLSHCICLDKDWKEIIAPQSTTTPISNLKPDNLAYVIYTSGSTGQPKGVMIEHQSIVNFVIAAQTKYNITSSDKVLQFAPVSFDVAAEEIYPCLTTGGTVVIRTDEMLWSASRFMQRCREWQITVLDLPTSYWHQLILELTKTKETLPESLRLVIIGGEPALPEALKLWQTCVEKLANPPQLLNAYGPTETTVEATCCDLSDYIKNHPTATSVPIGYPLNNVTTYILDNYLQPVPIGVAGELHIGGDGLARGYLGRPDVTAAKFIANPFSNKPQARLYKTGDLVRYLPDGKIEYLGRIDNQVKIRGFRIEIGEIEAAIAQHPQVRATAVIVREDTPGDKRLVAYIVAQQNPPTNSELYHFLKQRLPDYMIPAVWVYLDNLPVTANDKINYRALPVPDANLTRQTDYTAPRTEIEKQLVQIWSEVLNISQQIGINDNFFELGGHSLKVTQLIFRVREVFQIELPVLRFFQTPTVAELAQAIELAQQGNETSLPLKNISFFNLAAEAILDSAIVPETKPVLPLNPPVHSFLTGATGFMGAFLLYEILQQTPGNIYCLIRAKSLEAARRKLQNNLASYLLWNEEFSDRIIPVLGDLAQPLLGLSASKFEQLANIVDVIYHNGALVNSVLPYAQLKAANVNGTQEILRLACRQKIKPVHYISTISVFPLAIDAEESQIITEQHNPDDFAHELTNGYAQSKLVADKLVRIAKSRGIPVSIHRLGRITGHSQTGIGNTNDFLYRMIKGCIQLGSIPQRSEMVDMNPIDYVAKGIIALSQQPESFGKTFHFINPQTISWNQLVNKIRSLGYSIAELPEQQWREQIANLSIDASDNTLYPLLAMFSGTKTRKRSAALDFTSQQTLDHLQQLSITYPSVDDSLLSTYFSYLMKIGFLETPTAKILL